MLNNLVRLILVVAECFLNLYLPSAKVTTTLSKSKSNQLPTRYGGIVKEKLKLESFISK